MKGVFDVLGKVNGILPEKSEGNPHPESFVELRRIYYLLLPLQEEAIGSEKVIGR